AASRLFLFFALILDDDRFGRITMNALTRPGTSNAKETTMPYKPETRLQGLHLTLPAPPKPMAKYKPAVQAGNMLYVSGHGPLKTDGKLMVGGVGADLTAARGKEERRPPR